MLGEPDADVRVSVSDAVARHALESGECEALIDGESRLTFSELDRAATRVSRALLEAGIGAGAVVATCLDTSWQFVVAVLGIWRAKAAYLPVDPALPRLRIESIMADARPRAVLTERNALDFGVPADCREILLEDLGMESQVTGAEAADASAPCDLAQIATIIYTSGSSGAPKGVMITHGNLANLASSAVGEFRLTSSDIFLQVAQPSFSASLEELFPVLVAGGAIAIQRDRSRLATMAGMLDAIEQTAATVVELITPFWRAMGEEMERASVELPRSLRLVVVGGERAACEDARRWLDLGIDVVHVYGPTEYTATVTYYRANYGAVSKHPKAPLPIGAAIRDTRVYVLRPNMESAGENEIGEIFVSGAGLARGYVGAAGLTAERFVANPRSVRPGGRMYRTGDLGRWRPDGLLEFCGRADSQFKIRGYRIEPGDIEKAIEQHDAVSQAVVIPVPGARGSLRVVAYAAAQYAVAEADIVSFVAERLPEYMLPHEVVVVDRLPLTPFGKIDREVLRRAKGGRLEAAPGVTGGAIEEHIADVWAEVLGAPSVSRQQSFISLGGDSLDAMRVLARISSEYNLELRPADVLGSTGVAALAALISDRVQAPTIGAARPEATAASRSGASTGPSVTYSALAPAQECIWFLRTVSEVSSLYCESFTCKLVGDLQAEMLDLSFREVIHRHAILRSNIDTTAGSARWVVNQRPSSRVQIIDLSNMEEYDASAQLTKLTKAEASRPIALESESLIRATLYRLNETSYILQVSASHIAFDAKSAEILLRELATLYGAHVEGQIPELPELPMSYLDYAANENIARATGSISDSLEHWARTLEGAPTLLEISPRNHRPAAQSYMGGTVEFEVDERLKASILALAVEYGVTPFVVLFAGWAIVLGRYGRQRDILIGIPVEGRPDPAVADLIGLFVNTIILRVTLAPRDSYGDVLDHVMRALLDGMEHQTVPLDEVIAKLKPARSLSYHPVFQTLFSFQVQFAEPSAGGVVFGAPRNVSAETSKFDISLTMSDMSSGLIGELEYSKDLFDTGFVNGLARNYLGVLNSMVSQPGSPCTSSGLASPDESASLVAHGSGESIGDPGPDAKFVQQIAERWAAVDPGRIAVIWRSQEISYGALNGRANQLARYLRGAGVGRDVPVVLLLHKGPEFLVSLLAVLKAGGTYVPVDPANPLPRIARIVGDAGAEIVVTVGDEVSGLRFSEDMANAEFLILDDPAVVATISEYDDSELLCVNDQRDLCCVLYTSGSTGAPKGVMVPHESVMAYVKAIGATFGLCEEDRFLQIASVGFDVHIEEIFPVLAAGGAIVVVSDSDASGLTPTRLCEVLAQLGSTVCEVTTAYWSELVTSLERGDARLPSRFRLLVVGGEAASTDVYNRGLQQGLRIAHVYGLTECAVTSTVWRPSTAHVAEEEAGIGLPIGRPIGGTNLYVLDAGLHPVPVGIRGELYIAGRGLARGYLGSSGQTSARFVACPYGAPGERMYRTGDLARWRPDGNLEFLGREDEQVKVRGFRIELGDIEAVISRLASVAHVAVSIQERGPGEKLLVAYVVPVNGTPFSLDEIRSHAAANLPGYMIPAAFVAVDHLALTRNGKIDRQGLPVYDFNAPSTKDTAPASAEAQPLCRLFAETLGVPAVDPHSNFFELGGHSLLAMRLLMRIRAELGEEIPIRALFEAPTAAALADYINGDVRPRLTELPVSSQPCDQAEFEASDAGGALNKSALAYFRRVLADASPQMFRRPLAGQSPASIARAELHSPTMDLAAETVAARYDSSKPTVYLALFASLLTILSGVRRCTLTMDIANRETGLSRTLVSAFQPVPIVFDLTDDLLFSEIVSRAARASATTQRYARCSFVDLKEAEHRIAEERGVQYRFGINFNYLLTPSDSVPRHRDLEQAEASAGTISWPSRNRQEDIDLDIWCEVDPVSAVLAIMADTAIIPEATIESALRGFERTLIEVARGADPRLGFIAEAAGLSRPSEEGDWIVCDDSWISPPEITALMRSHHAVESCRTFIYSDEVTGKARLGVEVITGDENLRAGDLRRHALSNIDRCRSRIVPHWYIIHHANAGGIAEPGHVTTLVDVGSGHSAQRRECDNDQARALHSCTAAVLGTSSFDMSMTYIGAGGSIRKVPAIINSLRTLGCEGLEFRDLLTFRTLHQLSELLRPRSLLNQPDEDEHLH